MKKFLSLILMLAVIFACFNLGISFVSATGSDDLIKGATLSLGSSLDIDYYADLAGESIDNVTMRFTNENGTVKTVDGVYDTTSNLYRFTYTDINPQCMTDTIKAELLLDGETVLAEKDGYSVKAYCDSLASKEAGEIPGVKNVHILRKLLADTLIYGKEAQIKQSYKTDNLADASAWINSYKTSFVSPTGVKTIEGNQDTENYVKSASIQMANVNRVYFRLALADENVVIKLNDKEVDRSELIEQQDGSFVLYTEDIKATEFDKVFTLKLIKDGEVITTVNYNLNAYIQAKQTTSTVGALVQALNNYGVSATNYQAMLNGSYSGDYDLDDEDDLLGGNNLIPTNSSNFNSANTIGDTAWKDYNGNLAQNSSYGLDENGKCIYFNTTENSWDTLALDLAPYINEEGRYTISFRYKISGNCSDSPFSAAIRSTAENSFIKLQGNNYYYGLSSALAVEEGVWENYNVTFDVSADDISTATSWDFCLHSIKINEVDTIYIDDFALTHTAYAALKKSVTSAETWVSNEAVFVSDKWYDDAYREVTMDLVLTNGHGDTCTYTIPCFWDGGKIWRARFVCPTEGEWSYTTTCNDTDNTGLHNQTGVINCQEYTGDLDIYDHGFITAKYNNATRQKYFTYNDGTPFFYLGDTHWRFTDEPLKVVEDVVDTRADQGFTVMQTQGNFKDKLNNGVDIGDLLAFKSLDDKFKYIAEKGLVHANSQFFFPDQMDDFIKNFGQDAQVTFNYNGQSTTIYGVTSNVVGTQAMALGDGTTCTVNLYDFTDKVKTELRLLSRYWVARYSSYPVMWTLGQEVDNDFFFGDSNMRNGIGYGHPVWGKANNPYKLVAQYIGELDPYKSALTAHQEAAGRFNNTAEREEVFGTVTSHTWYAAQWKVKFNASGLENMHTAPSQYWNTNKVVVNYEGYYDGLETGNFGARAQGWLAYLSGMYGYGWGGQGTWEYNGDYLDDQGSVTDGVNTITLEQRQAANNVDNALGLASAEQMKFMRNFFENTVGDWHTLVPRFDNTNYLELSYGSGWSARAAIASNEDNSKIVIYFLHFSTTSIDGIAVTPNVPSESAGTATGILKNLTYGATYQYEWYNPSTGELESSGAFNANQAGERWLGYKADRDMVLYVYKQ